MGFKNTFLLILAVLTTIVIMQNNQPVEFHLLFSDFEFSNLWVMLGCFLIGICCGALLFRGNKQEQGSSLNDENRDYLDIES